MSELAADFGPNARFGVWCFKIVCHVANVHEWHGQTKVEQFKAITVKLRAIIMMRTVPARHEEVLLDDLLPRRRECFGVAPLAVS